MTGSIFLIQGEGRLVAMTEQPYDSEELLQRLLADYPDVLAGDQMNSVAPRRWLLVSRETPVPGEEGGAGRWALDHLFLDQDAVPTLVEVKRGTDTRLRREVVGQLLDYAANGTAFWPLDSLRAQYDVTCAARGRDPEAVLLDLLGPDADAGAFWQRAGENLQTGRVRLLFVADVIPIELQRVVEFLNTQMSLAEVLAVEVRQFVGSGLQTLVPRVIGRTVAAQQRKSPAAVRRQSWDENAVFTVLEQSCTPAGVAAVERLLSFAREHGIGLTWGQGASPSVSARFMVAGRPVSVWTCYAYPANSSVELAFRSMRGAVAAERLQRLADRLRKIPGVAPRLLGLEQADYRKGPSLAIDGVLAQPGVMHEIEAALRELIEIE